MKGQAIQYEKKVSETTKNFETFLWIMIRLSVNHISIKFLLDIQFITLQKSFATILNFDCSVSWLLLMEYLGSFKL